MVLPLLLLLLLLLLLVVVTWVMNGYKCSLRV
jgi:hypothetical protein